MPNGARDVQVHSSPAVAANAEGDEIEVLESTDVLPVAPEDVSKEANPLHHCSLNACSLLEEDKLES